MLSYNILINILAILSYALNLRLRSTSGYRALVVFALPLDFNAGIRYTNLKERS